LEQYDEGPVKTQREGHRHPGPKEARFKDLPGNSLSVIDA
jgi:hypothetical protein